jgi:hypothetical protein
MVANMDKPWKVKLHNVSSLMEIEYEGQPLRGIMGWSIGPGTIDDVEGKPISGVSMLTIQVPLCHVEIEDIREVSPTGES